MGLISKIFRRKAHGASGPNLDSRIDQLLFYPTRTVPPRFGTRDLLQAYSTMPWLRAVSGKVATAVSVTQWRLFVIRDQSNQRIINPRSVQVCSDYNLRQKRIKRYINRKGSNGISKQTTVFSLEEIEHHPLLSLLEHGNERFTGQEVIKITQLHYDLTGEAFWLLEKDGLGVPVAIWPIPPHWIEDLPTKSNPYYRVYLGNRSIDIPYTEIVPFLDPDPCDPYGRGTGIARALADELETDEYAAKHVKTFFYNRARPDIIISADDLRPEDTKRLEQSWLERMRGFWNAYKPFFLNRRVEVKEIGQTFENMQLTQLRKHERDTIIQVYGAPPEKLGVLTQSNRSTIAAADLFWTKDLIMPRVEVIRRAIQTRLVPMFDERLILDYDSPVVEDSEHELSVMRAMPSAFTKNEWRAMANKDSLGEVGDVFVLQPGQVQVPMDQAGFVGQLENPDGNNQDDQNDQNNDNNQNDQSDNGQGTMFMPTGTKEQTMLLIQHRVAERVREHIRKKIRERRS